MSQSGNNTLNGKVKTLDDPNVKVVRELSNLPCNKHCFDCGQRGPTYVNITIGSFVCMTCSGLLRGLTPPHRVKSISMATFTVEEIDSLKSKGNEYCRKVWLATCTGKDSLPGLEKDHDRVTGLRTLMSVKYEQKRFYIDPSRLSETELGKIQAQTVTGLTSASHSSSSVQKSPAVSSYRPPSSYPESKLRNTSHTPLSQTCLPNSVTLPDIKSLTSLVGPKDTSMIYELGSKTSNYPHPINFENPNLQQPIPQKHPCDNLNGDIIINAVENYRESNFANFEDAFSQNQLEDSNNSNFFARQNQNSVRINNNNCKLSRSEVNNISSFAPHGSSLQIPILPYNNDNIINSSQINQQSCNTYYSGSSNFKLNPIQSNPCDEDKYAALKDLDSLFKQTASQDANTSEKGLTASPSLPSKLSSCEWFSSTSNPFVQVVPTTNPHNPFSGNIKCQTLELNGPNHLKYQQSSGQIAIAGAKINPFECTPSANPNNPFL